MELRHLRYFVAVAEEQNITKAAARLYVSQPPLSRQIRDLEKELGLKLFSRTATAIRLTEAGRIFLNEARCTLQRAEEAVETTRAFALGKRGQIRVGYATSPTVELLPRILRLFRQTHPTMSVDLLDLSNLAMFRGLREGTLDAALIVSIAPQDFSGFKVDQLGSYEVRLAIPKKHRFSRMREVRLKDVVNEPMIAFTRKENPEARAGLLKIMAPYTDNPNIVEEYDSVMSLIAAVEAGRGVAMVFQTLSVIAGKRVSLRPLTPAPPSLPVAIAYRAEGISSATAAFVAAAKMVKAKQCPQPVLRA